MRPKLTKIDIILVDDHKLIIQAYTSLLKEVNHFNIIGSAHNGQEALELLIVLKPHVIILDADMPVMNGYETLKVLHEKYPEIKVIVLTMHKQIAYVYNYLINGAHAFLGKECEQDELIKAIDKVVEEGYYFSSTVSRMLVSASLRDDNFKESYQQLRLTDRETDILKLICRDIPNEDIARSLNISANTIKFFKKNIYRKTNTKTAIGLIKYAIRNGIVAVE